MLFSIFLLFHVIGASVWFGGLMVLSCSILPKAKRAEDPGAIVRYFRHFLRIGYPALVVQVLTGPMLATRLIPKMSDWFAWENGTQDHIGSKLIMLPIIVIVSVQMQRKVLPRLEAGEATAIKSAAKYGHSLTFLSFLMLLMGISLHTYGFSY
jgi:putative copper export protein